MVKAVTQAGLQNPMSEAGVDVFAAAQRAVAVQTRYARAGLGLAQAALAGACGLNTLRHYPAGDVIDPHNRSQFYYHAHGSRRRPTLEHGHFHLFVRQPANGDQASTFFHLVALSLDAQGWPLRWFTTNRWVTGETWVPAETAIAALPGFRPATKGRLAPVAVWLGAMVALYADTITALLRRRDRMVARRLHAGIGAEALFEDRQLDVITETQVSLPRRLQQLAGLS